MDTGNHYPQPLEEGDTPESVFGVENLYRRLWILSYRCSLCHENHDCQKYISRQADSLEEYARSIVESLYNNELPGSLFEHDQNKHHAASGDLDRLHNLTGQQSGNPQPHCIAGVMTPEEKYTCDLCKATFSTMMQLRQHNGLDRKNQPQLSASTCQTRN